MARVLSVFSLTHLFMVSLALNISLILRLLNDKNTSLQNLGGFNLKNQKGVLMSDNGSNHGVEFYKRALLSLTSTSATAITVAQDDPERVINVDHGDPTMYEKYWRPMGNKATIVIQGWQFMSYFSDVTNICWFLEPEFAREIKRLHEVVGNAVTEGRHIVVGTGSTQLFLAALYALSPSDVSEPISVVSAAPFYSSYPYMTDCLKSGLYKWAGDARTFDKNGPYIELVTTPNNPDGFSRQSVVNRSDGILVHDLAYYWPQYTPISSSADHDLMLFTVSKSTGHAGMRIGWALVKDEEVAKKMTKFIELNTIGVSKDSQLRASKMLSIVSDSCEPDNEGESFFEFGYNHMVQRWQQLREAVEQSGQFSLPDFPSGFCNFFSRVFEPHPAFAWLKCEGETEDCESLLRRHKILTRGGTHFGMSPKYVRISMLDRDRNFNLFTKRLSAIRSPNPPSTC